MDAGFSELLKFDKCSPLIVYIIIVVITMIHLYNTRTEFGKLGENEKVKNIQDMFTWSEISYMLIVGVLIYGLCQYNESTLAWAVLFAPLIVHSIKTLVVYFSVHNVMKLVPKYTIDPNINLPYNKHPTSAMGLQNAVDKTIHTQAQIQTPQQTVQSSRGLGFNETPGQVQFMSPLNANKGSMIQNLNSMQSNFV